MEIYYLGVVFERERAEMATRAERKRKRKLRYAEMYRQETLESFPEIWQTVCQIMGVSAPMPETRLVSGKHWEGIYYTTRRIVEINVDRYRPKRAAHEFCHHIQNLRGDEQTDTSRLKRQDYLACPCEIEARAIEDKFTKIYAG